MTKVYSLVIIVVILLFCLQRIQDLLIMADLKINACFFYKQGANDATYDKNKCCEPL